MQWRIILADTIAAVHLAYVLVVVLGLLSVLLGTLFKWTWTRNLWFRGVHLTMIGIVVVESLCGIPCPLTVWESQLRAAAGGTFEPQSFVPRLIHQFLFCTAPPIVFTVAYCLFGLLVLAALWFHPPMIPKRFARARN